VALLEVVTEPDMRSGVEAAAYGSELRRIVTFLAISNGNMQVPLPPPTSASTPSPFFRPPKLLQHTMLGAASCGIWIALTRLGFGAEIVRILLI
jgi:hypothetical protein